MKTILQSTVRDRSIYLYLCLFFSFINLQNVAAFSAVSMVRDTIPIPKKVSKKVTGTITDSKGNPMPGVSILVENSEMESSTDVAGNFEITLPNEAVVLAIGYPGYTTNYVNTKDRAVINIALAETETINEEIAIGYGVVTRSTLTGAVASLSGEQIETMPLANSIHSLQSKVAGVDFHLRNPSPEPLLYTRIRGAATSSINSSPEPLYVVDGFVSGIIPVLGDIASIQILKDAASTSIYGARASGGVILITTKRGKEGRPRVTMNTSFSTMEASKKIDLINAEQYAEYNPIIDEITGVNTDWQDEIFRRGNIQNHQLSISGGSESVNYYISGVYYDQLGVLKNSDYERLSLMSNIDIKMTERLTFGANFFGFRSAEQFLRTQETRGGEERTGVITSALKMGPDLPVYDENGNYTKGYNNIDDDDLEDELDEDWRFDNPVALSNEIEDHRTQSIVQSTFSFDFDLTKNLSLRSVIGGNIDNKRLSEEISREVNEGFNDEGKGEIEGIRRNFFLTTNYLTYSKVFKSKHDFILMSGYSFESLRDERWQAEADNYINNDVSIWGMDQDFVRESEATSSLDKTKFSSWFSRLNYAYDNRYVVTLNATYEGSSVYGKDKKWGFFPSIGLAWNIHNEKFLENATAISQLKWRASYGMTGNQDIKPYESLGLFNSIFIDLDGGETNALYPTEAPNSKFTWETTTQLNVGIDVGIFKDRFRLIADYYHMETGNLIFRGSFPAYTGFDDQWRNDGKLKNQGLELTLQANTRFGDFKWTTQATLFGNRNTIVELPQGQSVFYDGAPRHLDLSETHILEEGEAIGAFFGFAFEGFDSEGKEIYTDVNGDGKYDRDDKMVIGQSEPDFMWGFDNYFSWKNLDMNLFLLGSQGNDVVSYSFMEIETLNGRFNTTTEAYNEWVKLGRPELDQDVDPTMSSRWIYDGSYLRLRNISLGYSLPNNVLDRWPIERFRVYISAQNIWTYSNYRGYDPEVNFNNNERTSSNLNKGQDFGSYPNVKSYTVGLNVVF